MSDNWLHYMLTCPEPLLPEVISSRFVQWNWDGLWQTRSADFGWLRIVVSTPYFNYRQKALTA